MNLSQLTSQHSTGPVATVSILITYRTVGRVIRTVHSSLLVIRCPLSATLVRLSSAWARMPYLLLFYYLYLAYNGLEQASQLQIAPSRVRIVTSTLIAMSFSDGKRVPLTDCPMEGLCVERKSQKVIIHLALLAAISREILCQQKNVHSKSAQLLL